MNNSDPGVKDTVQIVLQEILVLFIAYLKTSFAFILMLAGVLALLVAIGHRDYSMAAVSLILTLPSILFVRPPKSRV